ncbi:phosphatase PAP2 family protein [Actinacidiphila acididurans]|uniref:Phosphatase PAP2 family protein n=1 Tax=Actinacidiphila acididurans TaxID=2784346 RepID=A0ABS2TQN3_9ACTN|nr:phosphatase PAP2 family protein [Actinacidiphila acididurans]MBM9505377.1 phosphatase PAP2 family protein [Actinacidiphila acididurans]
MGELTAKTMNGRSAAASRSARTAGTDAGSGTEGATGVTRTEEKSTLLARLRTPRNPRLWFEILLIGASYWLYSLVRNAVPEQQSTALKHAKSVWSFEGHLGLDVERSVNHAMNSVDWLIVGMNYYYATLHFIITIGVLVWLYLRHPGRYGPARLVLFVTTWLALVGFYAYPLAPPRLMTNGHFIDTVKVHNTWGSMSQGSLSHVSNQFAAMPSMHIGWSLWCGITLVTLARPLWAKILGGLYPVATLLVIVSTGNHFWMDAAGGALCLAVGYTVAYLLYGRWVYRLPRAAEPLPVK